jgi:hypothetical protein
VTSHEPYEVSIWDVMVYLHVHTSDFVAYTRNDDTWRMTRHVFGPNKPNMLTEFD